MPLAMNERQCAACGKFLPAGSHSRRMFCPEKCEPRKRPAPAVYRFVAPDGRCYVGSVSDISKRNQRGLERSNPWIDEALLTYPSETWVYEVLENLPPGCSKETMFHAERKYMEQFRSWMKEHGFNMQRLVVLSNAELEQQAVERAVKAGEASAKSDKHVSKTRSARRGRQ